MLEGDTDVDGEDGEDVFIIGHFSWELFSAILFLPGVNLRLRCLALIAYMHTLFFIATVEFTIARIRTTYYYDNRRNKSMYTYYDYHIKLVCEWVAFL